MIGDPSANTPSTSSSNTPSATAIAETSSAAELKGQPRRKGPHPKAREILESTCLTLRNELNAGRITLSNPKIAQMFDPTFQAVMTPNRLDLDAYVAHLSSIYESNPEYHVDLTDMDTVIDEGKGTARVFLSFGISGIFEGVTRASVAVLKFREVEDGVWKLWRYEAADGMSGNVGVGGI